MIGIARRRAIGRPQAPAGGMVLFDSSKYATGGSLTHTTSANALTNALLLVFCGTANDDTPPTTVTVNGTSIHANNLVNSAAVNSGSDSMGTWCYYLALGSIAASQTYSVVVSGGAGDWAVDSVVVKDAKQTVDGTYTVAGSAIDNPGNIVGASVPLAVPPNGLVIQNAAIWSNNATGTMTGNGTSLEADSSNYNQGWYGTQYTSTVSPLTWTFSAHVYTCCVGSWGIPAA